MLKKSKVGKEQAKRIRKLREKNDLSIVEIGKIEGRHPSTIFRVLERTSKEYQALQQFKSNDAELLDDIRFKNNRLRAALYDSLMDENFTELRELPADKRVQLIHPLTVDSGIDTEKSLLLKGKATSIVSNQSLVITASRTIDEINARLADAQIIGNEADENYNNVDNSSI